MADLTLYVRRELASRPEIVSMVGSTSDWPVWIWRWRPYEEIEGTGKRAIVISQPRPWTSPNRHNTAEFPQVVVEAYADPSRDPDGRPTRKDAEERALELADAVRKILHVPQGGPIEWGDAAGTMRVVSSVAGQDPEVAAVPDSDGLVRARQAFEVVLG